MALQKVFYLFSDIILVFGIIELIQHRKIRNFNIKSKAEKITEFGLCPEKQTEELKRTISIYRKAVKIMVEKLKRFFSYIISNKETLIANFLNISMTIYVEYVLITDKLSLIPFFAEHYLAISIVSGILASIYVVISSHAITVSCGWENPEQCKARLENQRIEKENKLTKEQKKAVKEEYKKIEETLKSAQLEYNKYKNVISNFKTLSDLGLSISNEKQMEYDNACNNIGVISNNIERLKRDKERCLKSKK